LPPISARSTKSGPPPEPVIVVHSLAHATAALRAATRAGRAVVLASAPGAGSYVGPGWFRELIAAAREAVPEASFSALLDCGDDRGAALAAIRSQVEGVVFTGPADVARRLADIATQHGVGFVTERPEPALDLGEDFFAPPETLEPRCAELLAGHGSE
jgi:acyl-CoA reductase-like NAD-dependent aldehyde dehydrogenase